MRAQVLSAQREISAVTGARPWPWFRFPFGDHNDHTIAVVNSLGFATIGWTVDTLGWEGTSRGITVALRTPGVTIQGNDALGDRLLLRCRMT